MSDQIKNFFNNLLANATWALVGKVLGWSFVTALITALWEKIKHGSLDWYAIGGMFVITCVVVLANLRKGRQQINNTAQTSNVALMPGIPTLSALLGQNPTFSFDARAFFAHSYYSPLTADAENNIKIIAQQYSPNDKEAFYARFIGVGSAAYFHDITWFTIFKSQLLALTELNARGIVPLAEVRKHYDKAKHYYPLTYASYSFDDWINYMRGRSLIIRHPSDMVEVTHGGKDFLKYVAHAGWDVNAKAN